MTAFVQQQAEAFNSGVMREHREAMGFADVLEFLRYSRAQTEGMIAVIRGRLAAGQPAEADSSNLQRICRETLAALTHGKTMQRDLEALQFEFPAEAVASFDDSTLDLRDLLAVLVDPRPRDEIKLPSEQSCQGGQEPPPSWHEEEVKGLTGPF
jgi:hypothetical protein